MLRVDLHRLNLSAAKIVEVIAQIGSAEGGLIPEGGVVN